MIYGILSRDIVFSLGAEAKVAQDIKIMRVSLIVACVLTVSAPICFQLTKVNVHWGLPALLFSFLGPVFLIGSWISYAQAKKRHARIREIYPVLEQFKTMRAAERKAASESGKPRILWGPTLFKWSKWWVIGCWTVYGIAAIGLILEPFQ